MTVALNGSLIQAQHENAGKFLSAQPRGAYTTFLSTSAGLPATWQSHFQRLMRSLELLAAAGMLDAPDCWERGFQKDSEV